MRKHLLLVSIIALSMGIVLAGCTEVDSGDDSDGSNDAGDQKCRENPDAHCVSPDKCESGGEATGYVCGGSDICCWDSAGGSNSLWAGGSGEKDSDGDGYPDSEDDCPNEYGGGTSPTTGCPGSGF